LSARNCQMDSLRSRLAMWTATRNKGPFVMRGNGHIRHTKECRRAQIERKLVRRLLRPLFPEDVHVGWVLCYLGMGAVRFTEKRRADGIIRIPRPINSRPATDAES